MDPVNAEELIASIPGLRLVEVVPQEQRGSDLLNTPLTTLGPWEFKTELGHLTCTMPWLVVAGSEDHFELLSACCGERLSTTYDEGAGEPHCGLCGQLTGFLWEWSNWQEWDSFEAVLTTAAGHRMNPLLLELEVAALRDAVLERVATLPRFPGLSKPVGDAKRLSPATRRMMQSHAILPSSPQPPSGSPC